MSVQQSLYFTASITEATDHPLFRGDWRDELIEFYHRMGWHEAMNRAKKEGVYEHAIPQDS
jgi:hypothetical protein